MHIVQIHEKKAIISSGKNIEGKKKTLEMWISENEYVQTYARMKLQTMKQRDILWHINNIIRETCSANDPK